MMKLTFCAIVWLLSCPLLAGTFKALAASGDVFVWHLDTSDWLRITGQMELAEHSIVQVRDGAVLKLKFPEPSTKSLTLSKPCVLRLSETMLRQIEVETLNLSKLPGREDLADKTQVAPIDAAWERLLVFTKDLSGLLKNGSLSSSPEQAMLSAHPLPDGVKIIEPGKVDFREFAGFPAHFDVSWVPEAGKEVVYEILLSSPGESGKLDQYMTVGETTASSWRVQIFAQGKYGVVVRKKSNHEIRSEVRHVIAAQMDSVSIAKVLKLKTPGLNYVELLPAGAVDASITFSWQRTEILSPQANMTLSITDVDRNKEYRIPSSSNQRNVRLKAGRYTWHVEWLNVDHGSNVPLQSCVRTIQIKKDAALADLIPAKGNAIIRLGE